LEFPFGQEGTFSRPAIDPFAILEIEFGQLFEFDLAQYPDATVGFERIPPAVGRAEFMWKIVPHSSSDLSSCCGMKCFLKHDNVEIGIFENGSDPFGPALLARKLGQRRKHVNVVRKDLQRLDCNIFGQIGRSGDHRLAVSNEE
jgi:hypothetical protein